MPTTVAVREVRERVDERGVDRERVVRERRERRAVNECMMDEVSVRFGLWVGGGEW